MSSLPDTDEDPFLITSPLAIRALLRSIQRHASLLRMYISGNPDQSLITTILALDDSEQRVMVDCSQDADFNDRLTHARAVVFDTQLDQIHVHFMAHGFQQTTYADLPALSFPFPSSVRRIQRREFYRVEIPMGEPATCVITLADPGKSPRRIRLKLRDISAGGVALLDPENLLPHEAGSTLKNVQLTLPEVGEVTVDLEVLRVHTNVLPSKKEIVELACKFVKPSNASTLIIQSYISRLERRMIAKRRGF